MCSRRSPERGAPGGGARGLDARVRGDGAAERRRAARPRASAAEGGHFRRGAGRHHLPPARLCPAARPLAARRAPRPQARGTFTAYPTPSSSLTRSLLFSFPLLSVATHCYPLPIALLILWLSLWPIVSVNHTDISPYAQHTSASGSPVTHRIVSSPSSAVQCVASDFSPDKTRAAFSVLSNLM